jgi:ArsR family transcriptional regulator
MSGYVRFMETTAEQLKALSDPTRLRIIHLLAKDELCVCDLMEALRLPQSTISRHMSFLKHAKWATARRSGKWMYYRLALPENPLQQGVLKLLQAELPSLPMAKEDKQRLCNHLATKQSGDCA